MKSDKRPTFKDLMKKTGVSQGAISRALNGQEGLSEDTRKMILKTAREIGYYPNPSARNFKRGYSGRIGIILPNLRNTNYSALYERFDQAITRNGQSSVLALTHDDTELEADIIMHWSAGETDALIVNPVRARANRNIYLKLRSWHYPLLFIYGSPGEEFDYLSVDIRSCMKKALTELRESGHREVAFVGIVPSGDPPGGKYGLMRELLPEIGLAYDESASVLHVNGDEAGVKAFARWEKIGRLPTAVMAYNDHTASSLYREARAKGLGIPEKFSLLGSDDVAEAQLMGLTTFRTNRAEFADMALRMLQKRMGNLDGPAQYTALEAEYVPRDSHGLAPVSTAV